MNQSSLKKIMLVVAASAALLSACRAAGMSGKPIDDARDLKGDAQAGEGTGVENPTRTPVTQPTPTVAPLPPAHPASGLTFSNAEGTWWVDWEGEVALLTDEIVEAFSPDWRQGLYVESGPESPLGDIWIVDLVTGEKRRITDTPERAETTPRFAPGQNGLLVFGSDTELGMANAGYPTVVGIDGSGYEVLDTETGGFRGVSPDGSAFIYGGYGATQMVYRWDSDVSVFDPTEYGLAVEKMFDPAWSPGADRIAWFVAGDFAGTGTTQLGLAVFDLQANSATLAHTYAPIGGSEFINQLAWSPDGSWLAFTTYSEPPAAGRAPNLWVIRADGTEETYVGEGSTPVWRYDGQSLAYQALNEAQTEEVFLVEAGSWQVSRIDDLPLPERILFLLDWRSP